MAERASAGYNKGKKSKSGNSNTANCAKPSLRVPQRITTVQKLHQRLQEAGVGPSDRRCPSDTDVGAGTGSGASANPTGGAASRDSSPGIDRIPPPQEPPAEAPPTLPPKKSVKRTAAEIFRELARCRAEQEEELRRLSALEFVPVAEEVVNKKAIDLQQKVALDRAERRLIALLSLEKSIVSKEKDLEQKKKNGEKLLQEKQNLRSVLAELRAREQALADSARRAVVALRERARGAVSAAAQQKVAHARQFGEQVQMLVERAQRQREEERQQRARLIGQIRQLETGPRAHTREADLTETAGHGLLDEMSVVELRERLALLKMQQSAELLEKNKMILQMKRMQEKQMEEAEKILEKFHNSQALERRQRRERSAQPSPPPTSQRLDRLQSELQLRRAERLQRAERRRAERRPRRHLAAGTTAPQAAAVRSAPPGVGRTLVTAVASQRRTKSDSCVKTQSASTDTVK